MAPDGRRLLVDHSAFSRVRRPSVAEVWIEALWERRLVACPAFLIEAGYSARSPAQLHDVRAEIAQAMDTVPCDEQTWDIAFAAQLAMAEAAGLMHRRRPLDFLIAATAHQHGLGVLHYDQDYDVIAEHGGLDFASVWVVPRGSLDG